MDWIDVGQVRGLVEGSCDYGNEFISSTVRQNTTVSKDSVISYV
jgi:hypothetical protein